MELANTQLAEIVNSNIEEYEFPSMMYSVQEALQEAEQVLYASDAYKKVLALKEKVSTYEKNRKEFEKMLIEEIGEGGILETKTHYVTVKPGNVSTSVEVVDIDLVPDEFLKITKEAKKTEAGKILRRDGTIPGLSLKQNIGAPKLVIERKELEIINAE